MLNDNNYLIYNNSSVVDPEVTQWGGEDDNSLYSKTF